LLCSSVFSQPPAEFGCGGGAGAFDAVLTVEVVVI
jgi:hypothetical protein